MEQDKPKKSTWGGARPGAGRKRTAVRTYEFYALPQVDDILQAVTGNRSQFINQCILRACQGSDEATAATAEERDTEK
ncbi:MAG: hypothetical protein ILA34_00100 [Bacteroidaceae bacterium]|nr:hypothetical protein [Bacteroidaceae bacterium]